jgi:hypothetical protein
LADASSSGRPWESAARMNDFNTNFAASAKAQFLTK